MFLLGLADSIEPDLMVDAIEDAIVRAERLLSDSRVRDRSLWSVCAAFVPEAVRNDGRMSPVRFFQVKESDRRLFGGVFASVTDNAYRQTFTLDDKLVIRTDNYLESIRDTLFNTATLLRRGQPVATLALLNSLRSELRTQGGAVSATIHATLLGSVKAAEFISAYRNAEFNGSLDLLSRRGLAKDLEHFLNVAESKYEELKSFPLLYGHFGEYAKMLSRGKQLLKVANSSGWAKNDPLIWLSATFLRNAARSSDAQCGAQCIALSVRALESYCLHLLIESGSIEFDGDTAAWRGSGVRVSGTGPLWKEVGSRGLSASIPAPIIDGCDVAIRLRNRGLFGHGVQNISASLANTALKPVKDFIEAMEARSMPTAARWRTLWDLSQPVDEGEIIDMEFRAMIDRSSIAIPVVNNQ